MQTEISTNYQFVSPSSQANLPNKPSDATGGSEAPEIAVGASAIVDSLGLGERECAELEMSRYVDGLIDSYQEATIRRHDEALASLPNMAREASARGEDTVVIDCRAFYRNFAYPQLNYPSPYEVLRVVAAIEAQGFTAVLEPVNPGRGAREESSHSVLYQMKARF